MIRNVPRCRRRPIPGAEPFWGDDARYRNLLRRRSFPSSRQAIRRWPDPAVSCERKGVSLLPYYRAYLLP